MRNVSGTPAVGGQSGSYPDDDPWFHPNDDDWLEARNAIGAVVEFPEEAKN